MMKMKVQQAQWPIESTSSETAHGHQLSSPSRTLSTAVTPDLATEVTWSQCTDTLTKRVFRTRPATTTKPKTKNG